MDEYTVVLLPRAYRDLDNIYGYIAEDIQEPDTAKNMLDLLEKNILSLRTMPGRGAERKTGAYAKKGYRQIFVKNFTIIYHINEEEKEVEVFTIRYTPRRF